MARVLYVGDEATAAGFRLAGAETSVATRDTAADALREALAGGHECVLFSGRLAGAVPAVLLDAALTNTSPLFAVIPDVLGRGAPPDLAGQVRAALGLDA